MPNRMVRNTLLFLALAGLATVGYLAFVNWIAGGALSNPTNTAGPGLPDAVDPASQPSIQVGPNFNMPGGKSMVLTVFDPRTGKARDRFQFQTWKPIDGNSKELEVEQPELMLSLAGGLVAYIRADEGQVTVERLQQQTQQAPRRGSLRGGAKIVLDRVPSIEAFDPNATDSKDRVTIELDDIRFDMQLGTLAADGRVRVNGPQFQIDGRGLALEWSSADNQLKKLRLREAKMVELTLGQGLLPEPEPDAPAASDATSRPVAADTEEPRREYTAYELMLHKNVRIDQFRGEQRVAGLQAEEVRIVLDVGRNAKNLVERPDKAAASSPTSAPAEPNEERALAAANVEAPTSAATSAPAVPPTRVVVQWDGELELKPQTDQRVPVGAPRRRFIATGEVVRLTQGEGFIECGRVEFYDESQQLWLAPGPSGSVRLQRGAQTAATADSIYLDRRRGIVKLVGDVQLRTQERNGRGFAITASLWGELKLRPEAPASPESAADAAATSQPRTAAKKSRDPLQADFSGIESARFQGDVTVDLDGDRLQSEELELTFATPDEVKVAAAAVESAEAASAPAVAASRPAKAASDGSGIERLLRRAIANGSVRYKADDQSLRAERLELYFEEAPNGAPFPARTLATGRVRVRNRNTFIAGRAIEAITVPVLAAGAARSQQFALKTLEIREQAFLRDPDADISAEGERVIAEFGDDNRLLTARVVGDADTEAEIAADNYRVRGRAIDLDPKTRTLQVDGRSTLAFDASRALGRRYRKRPMLVEITSDRALKVDATSDQIQFSGNVVARSGDEYFAAETLTLFLRATQRPQTVKRPQISWLAPVAALYEFERLANARPRREEPVAAPSSAPVATKQPPARPRRAQERLRDLAGAFRSAAFGVRAREQRLPAVQLGVGSDDRGARRDPVRMLAETATFRSETYGRNRKPTSTAEVISPKLTFDILERRLVSEGRTVLMMTSRSHPGGEGAAPVAADDTLGLPSPLITRGPSQTGLKCEKSMTFQIGRDSTGGRRDAVVFDGKVRFIYNAGKRMLDLERELPDWTAADIAKLPTRATALDCDRLEGEFLAEKSAEARDPRGGLKLAWLMASGNVNLRDEQGPQIRSVFCNNMEFNREKALVSVNGTPAGPARIYLENPQSGQGSTPFVGESFTIDLKTNQVRSQGLKGEFRR